MSFRLERIRNPSCGFLPRGRRFPMIDELIPHLPCVECRSPKLAARHSAGREPAVHCDGCGAKFSVTDGILRMVPRDSALRRPHDQPEQALALDDGMQAAYWEDDGHGFRPPDDPVVQFFASQRWRYLSSRVDLSTARTALDVGCGDGFSTLYAPPHFKVTACDGSLTMLRRHRGSRRLQVDAFRLPFRDRSFDLVFCWELLHHVSQPHEVLAEMARVSNQWVIVCEPNPLNPAQFAFSWYDRAHRWVLRFSKRYLRDQARIAGLQVEHFARCGWIFPNKTPAWMFRMVKRLPYRLPLLGITSCMIARRDGALPAERHSAGQAGRAA
jgi:SAM-dependent methyltransferase